MHPEIARSPQLDRQVEAEETPDPLGPARGIALALTAGSIGWALLLSAIL